MEIKIPFTDVEVLTGGALRYGALHPTGMFHLKLCNRNGGDFRSFKNFGSLKPSFKIYN